MFSWLAIIILAYVFFSIAFLGDKLILQGPASSKFYTFCVGMLGSLVLVLLPFATFTLPAPSTWLAITFGAAAYLAALYVMFSTLEQFEVSRVMPAVGALQPLFILLLSWVWWGPQITDAKNIIAFVLLVAGSVLISIEKSLRVTGKYVVLTTLAALLFAFNFIFFKVVFLQLPFVDGLIWTNSFAALFALVLLIDGSLRKEVFAKKPVFTKASGGFFLLTQSAGGFASFLQNLAISLVPVSYLAIVNALRGVQYVFLFIITVFFSWAFPKILKEEISAKIIIQKLVSMALIAAGLATLVL